MFEIKFWQTRKKAALIIFFPLTVLMTGCDNEVYDSCLRTAEDTVIQASDRPFTDRDELQKICVLLKLLSQIP